MGSFVNTLAYCGFAAVLDVLVGLTMAYAIARSLGAPLGKGDFDGYHAYAPEFSFETPAAP